VRELERERAQDRESERARERERDRGRDDVPVVDGEQGQVMCVCV
jgi:hypothetical protein